MKQFRVWLTVRPPLFVPFFFRAAMSLLLILSTLSIGNSPVSGAESPTSSPSCIDVANKPLPVKGKTQAPVTITGPITYTESSTEKLMVQTRYNPNGWWGDVVAYAVDTKNLILNSKRPIWRAGELLNQRPWQSDAENGRQVITYNGYIGIPFKHLFELNEAQQTLIDQNQLDYLRGDRSHEKAHGGGFRNRQSVLGDMVSSAAVFHNGDLYVGANDGMLHVFEAQTGRECFAYIPNLIFKNLALLTQVPYAHHFFVNQTPVIQDIGGQTILVGGLGAGGRGYYCLDISDAAAHTERNAAMWVMWEFPDMMTGLADMADLGLSFSKPAIVNSNAGWIVLFGNGYNSPNGHAVLFVLDAEGKRLRRIDTESGPCNGLSTPVPVDVNNDYQVDFVYAGDLKGNLWKFDLTAADPESWGVAYYGHFKPQPLFQAKDQDGNGQPITTAPDIMYHCSQQGYLAVFGTGKYLGTSDLQDDQQQTLYGIWDYGDEADPGEYLGTFNRADVPQLSNQPDSVSLVKQEVEYSGSVDSHTYARSISHNQPDYALLDDQADFNPNQTPAVDQYPNPHQDVGWYFDLPLKKERIVTDVMIRDGNVLATSIIPPQHSSNRAGVSYMMVIDACTGSGLTNVQLDINRDGYINYKDRFLKSNLIPSGIKVSGLLSPPWILPTAPLETLLFSNSSGKITAIKQKAEQVGVLYWTTVDHDL